MGNEEWYVYGRMVLYSNGLLDTLANKSFNDELVINSRYAIIISGIRIFSQIAGFSHRPLRAPSTVIDAMAVELQGVTVRHSLALRPGY